ncbi:hypothetical protein E3N88_20178 [Mikania micrantha]|uniref:non-specific serine/threonine protein kinase n=1 Tax=Mikania micrantha TaxID=192012 RepID=A0A5N6NIV9_9ASTR|nr:hypothetical protein E3N88_20178 [Mikania micrantha]
MGGCTSKPSSGSKHSGHYDVDIPVKEENDDKGVEEMTTDKKIPKSPFFPFYSPSPGRNWFSKKSSPAKSPAKNPSSNSTPMRFLRRPFPPPSPAKHIKSVLARRQGSVKPNGAAIPEGNEAEAGSGLDKSFGFSKHFGSKLELGEEVGRGHFGYTCKAKFKKGEFKGQEVAVKVIPKSKMTTAIAIEDVRREVKILRAMTGHKNLVKFYDAYEDYEKVYVVMELCEGGELLDRILSRGGKYSEDDAKAVLTQILSVVAFCHLQGVVHRDLKPENFLFTSKDENSSLKAIDFGLSDFVKPDERLNDIVGSAYYVAPEVLHRSYSTEADVWSIGVIAYILLCGSRPFWARSESGIFRAVLKADPSFDEVPWPTLSSEAKDFVKRFNNANEVKVPLDISILRLMKSLCVHLLFVRLLYGWVVMNIVHVQDCFFNHLVLDFFFLFVNLQALSKTLTIDELFYLKEQFSLLEPSKSGSINMENMKAALMKHATDAMKESRVHDFLASLSALQYRRMDFEEFCAAAINIYQLEALDRWEQHARCAYELFEKDGNRAIMIEELASELGLSPSVPVHAVLHDWIRHTDGKLSFLGFVKLLHGVSSRALLINLNNTCMV